VAVVVYMMGSCDYAAGKWVGGLAWRSSRPIPKITRKHPARHGDEVRTWPQDGRRFATTADARAVAAEWAQAENAKPSTT